MDAVAQPTPFLLQFLGKTRPRTQFDQPWIRDMQPAEQTPVKCGYAVTQHIGVPTIVLRTGNTEPVTQAVELLGVDRVHHKASIDQTIHHRSVWHFDLNSHRTGLPGDRQQPVTQLRQTRTAMGERMLSRSNAALTIHNTNLVPFRAPVDAGKPPHGLLCHRTAPSSYGPSRRLPSPGPALDGATSYWASVVANPPGHWSKRGASSTGITLVAPGGPARPVSLL